MLFFHEFHYIFMIYASKKQNVLDFRTFSEKNFRFQNVSPDDDDDDGDDDDADGDDDDGDDDNDDDDDDDVDVSPTPMTLQLFSAVTSETQLTTGNHICPNY